jgi:site-specific recombinase XerD
LTVISPDFHSNDFLLLKLSDMRDRQQLFHLLHNVDISHEARYNAFERRYDPNVLFSPCLFAVSWPNGIPCTIVEFYLIKKLKDGATVQEDGGSLRAIISKLSHLIRHCWNIRRDFWELTDDDICALVDWLVEEKRKSDPTRRCRNNNTVRSIVANVVDFLLWLQNDFIIKPGLIGLGSEFTIILKEEKVFNTYLGRSELRTVFHYLPTKEIEEKKPAIDREKRHRLWLAVSELSMKNFVSPRWSAIDDLSDVNTYLKCRRELLLELLEGTGARPGELAALTVSANSDCYEKGELELVTLKRRKPMIRRIKLQPGVAVKLTVFIQKHRNNLLAMLRRRGSETPHQDRVFMGIGGQPLSPRSLEAEFTRLAIAAGLSSYRTCMSMFRHAFITKQVAFHVEDLFEKNNLSRSMFSTADYRTILKKVAKVTGHKNEMSLFPYIDLAWEELGLFDHIEAAIALDRIIERTMTEIISIGGELQGNSGREDLKLVRLKLQDLLDEIRTIVHHNNKTAAEFYQQ